MVWYIVRKRGAYKFQFSDLQGLPGWVGKNAVLMAKIRYVTIPRSRDNDSPFSR